MAKAKKPKTKLGHCYKCNRKILINRKMKAGICKKCVEKYKDEFIYKPILLSKKEKKVKILEKKIFKCKLCDRKDVCYSIPGTRFFDKIELMFITLGLKYKQRKIDKKIFHSYFDVKISKSRIFRFILNRMGFSLSDIYFTTLIKCPIYNRKNLSRKIENCLPFLIKQIDVIKPVVVIISGKLVARSILKEEVRLFKFIKKDGIRYFCFPNIKHMITIDNIKFLIMINKFRDYINKIKGHFVNMTQAIAKIDKEYEDNLIRQEREGEI